mgnify:CR=1 FL=1
MTFINARASLISTYLLMMLICFIDRDIVIPRQHIDNELKNANRWFCSNKLSLNIEKSSYVIFHPSQKKISDHFNLVMDDVCLKKERSIKYHGNRI